MLNDNYYLNIFKSAAYPPALLNQEDIMSPEQKKFESMTWEQWVMWIVKIIEDIINNLPPEIAKQVRKGISNEIHN